MPDENSLKHYFTKDPKGLARWANHAHPWTALYNILKKHMTDERAKRIAASWYHLVFGKWPGDKKGKAAKGKG